MNIEIRTTPLHYEAYADGERVGELAYSRQGELVTAIHTVVIDEMEGQGVGGKLARSLLDDARSRGQRVVAQCPFVKGWLDRHPDYQDLVVT